MTIDDEALEALRRATAEAISDPEPVPTPTTAPAVSPPAYEIDEDVAHFVAQEVIRLSHVSRHIPSNIDGFPPQIRSRLWDAVEQALVPEPALGWLEGESFMREPEPVKWLINDLITSAEDGGRVLVAGPEKSFKSLFAVACMVAVASGQPMLGWDDWNVPEPGRVLAFFGEGGSEFNRSRVVRLCEGLGFSDETKATTFSNIRMLPQVLSPERLAIHLEKQLELEDWKLVIVDSMYAYSGETDRNQLAQMGSLLIRWAELAEQAGTTLMVVDHFRKAIKALELASVSGVGASQWAQAWALMRAEYKRRTDTALMKVKTGARQSVGGVYEIMFANIMDGPITAHITIGTDDEEEEEDDIEIRMLEAVIKLNQDCARDGEWVAETKLRRIYAVGDERVYDHIIDQPHVHVVKNASGTRVWVFALDSSGAMPGLPRGATATQKEGIPPEPATDPTPTEET